MKRFGRFEIASACASVYMLTKGMAYLGVVQDSAYLPRGLQLITQYVSIQAWGVLWLLVGLWALWAAFTRNTDRSLAAVAGLLIAWGFAHIYGAVEKLFILEESSNSLDRGVGYLAFGLIVGLLSKRGDLDPACGVKDHE